MAATRWVDDVPPELLRMIFKCYVESHAQDAYFHTPAASELSHVCSRWRSIALATPDLWTYCLPCGSTQWTETCLSRSSASSFSFFISDSYFGSAEYRTGVDRVMNHIARAKTLRIEMTPQASPDFPLTYELLGRLCNITLPVLDSVALSFMDSTTIRWTPIIIPPDLLAALPKLSEITLRGCWIPKASSWFSAGTTLRSLHLSQMTAWEDTDDMVATLRTFPRLECLHLSWCSSGKLHAGFQSRHVQCVRLDQLNSLVLEHDWRVSLCTFMCLLIPSDTDLTFLSRGDRWHDLDQVARDELLSLVSQGKEAFRQHFAPAIALDSSYRALDVSLDSSDRGLVLSTDADWTSSLQPKEPRDALPTCVPRRFRINIPQAGVLEISRAALEMILNLPIFMKMTHMSFSAYLWAIYPGVYRSHAGTSMLRVVDKLGARTLQRIILSEGTTFIPALKHLCLVRVADAKLVDDLVDALCAAHAATNTFECLELIECRLDEDTIGSVRRRLGSERVIVASWEIGSLITE